MVGLRKINERFVSHSKLLFLNVPASLLSGADVQIALRGWLYYLKVMCSASVVNTS